ncbi:MAG: phytase [Snowella sp.]|nr:phytase [Snowella sp.]
MTTLKGTTANDLLNAGQDFIGLEDTVLGLDGNDEIDAGLGTGGNTLGGGNGDDQLFAGKNDLLLGDRGNDELDASDEGGNNSLYGGAGQDRIYAGENDKVFGGAGDDSIFAGTGNNTLYGGTGRDRFWIANAELPTSVNTIADFDKRADQIAIQVEGMNTPEDLSFDQAGKDVVIKVKATGESIAVVQNTNKSDFNSNNLVFDSNSPLNPSQPIINPQDQNRKKVTEVESLGVTSFNTNTVFKDTQVGGLSGIVYDSAQNRYYAISDDRSQINSARFYTLEINLSDGRLDNGDVSFTGVTTLLDSQGNPFPLNSLDPEGIALTENGSVYISSEGDANNLINPFVNEFSLSGQQLAALPIDNKYFPTADQSKGIRNNLAFESLTLTPDRRYLYTATENALVQDGSPATLENSSLSRIIKYDLSTGEVVGEFVYEVDPVADTPNPAGSFATNGLVELLALDNNGTLLALERSFSTGVGNTVKLYEVLTQGALNVKDLADLYREEPLEDDGEIIAPDRFAIDPPVQKRLLLDFADLGITPDNLEGISLGPVLPDGRQSLIVVSDNNFSATQTTQFIALGLTVDTLPAVLPTVETPYTIDDGSGTTPLIGDSDDPAVWIDPTDSGNSLIIGTLKDGGLAVFSLEGEVLQTVTPVDMLGAGAEFGDLRYNNVDVLYNFQLGAETVDIAVVSDRANDTLNIFKINPATHQLESITAPTLLNDAFSIFGVDDGEMTAYGLAAYKSPVTGKSYVFVTQAGGNKIAQLELQSAASGTISASVVRTIELPIATGDDPEDYQSEAIAVDQEKGIVYLAVEGKIGIVKFAAEPNDSNQITVVRPVGSPELVPDLEGLAIYYGPNGTGYLVASSQGDSTYAVYSREENNTYLGSFVVGDNTALGIDQANETDGLEIINVPLGSAFPFGALLVQDGANEPQNVVKNDDELENNATNFKFIPWESVANAFQTPLLIDTTSYNPRTSNNNFQPPVDGNFDGIPDSEQPHVTSVQTPNNQFVTFVGDPLRPPAQIQAIANPSPGNAPANVTFPLGFFEFTLPQVTPGGASAITLYLPQGTNINTYWKFGPTPDNPSNHWYNFDFDPITQTGAQFMDLNGDGQTEIILNFVDGQRGDRDLTVNGQIQDPGAPAFTPNSAPTAITLSNLLSLIDENSNGGIKVADLTIIDDGQGINTLFLSGNDAASFEIRDNALFFIGSSPDFERQTQYQVTVNVDDPTVGNSPDAMTDYVLQVANLPDFDVSSSASKFGDDNNDGLGSLTYDFSGNPGNISSRADDNALSQTNALFHNLMGLYPVLNANGAILDSFDMNGNGLTSDLLNPGDAGYAFTAISNRVNNFSLQLGGNGNLDQNTNAEEFGDVLLQGGQLYAPFAIANGGNLIPSDGSIQDGINAFLLQNPSNTAATLDNFINHAVAYFSFGMANPDGTEHLQNRGNNIFGFEDLPGNLGISDFDFNDAVFRFNFLA